MISSIPEEATMNLSEADAASPESSGARQEASQPQTPSPRRLFAATDYITHEQFEIVVNAEHGWAQTQPTPAPKELAAYYPAGYYGTHRDKRFPSVIERLQDALYRYRARQLTLMNGGQPGRVLDVGCGRGLLLAQLQKLGWDVVGTELSEGSASYPREVLGLPVQVGDLADQHFPSGHFDAVVMWHVLEHVIDPAATMREVNRLLRPGGIFLIGVPNFASLEARVSGDKWFHLDVPRHLNHFTPHSLRRALKRTGLRVRRMQFFAPEFDSFSFVQSTLNRLGLRPNLLYNLLRGRTAKVIGADEGAGNLAPQVAATILLGGLLGVVSIPATLLAAALRQGATLTIYAEKQTEREA